MIETEFSNQLHAEKYRADGESFKEAMNRVASALTDDQDHFHVFRDILLGLRFLPAGRVQAAAGSPKRVTPYNCFVSGTIEDSFVDGEGSIMARATQAAATMRMGGGIGYDFSTLRPRGDLISKLGSRSSGPVSFMEIYDAICRCTASSGHRRGAQMGVLRVDHPDIERFVHVKQNEEKLRGFNISIGVTDEFMVCLEQGRPFMLRFEGRNYREIDPQALWEKIMRSTWDWAEPGVLFIDTINRRNNLRYCETIVATNPCFTGDTKVWTAEYGHVRFSDLVGKTVEVLTEAEDGRAVYRRMSNIRRTARDAKLVRVRLDNGTSVRCTPNHRFFLKDGTDKEAQHLRPGDALKGVYRYKANQRGYMRLTNGQSQLLEHHVPFENVEGLGSLVHAHHIDHDRANNRPSNLELIEAVRHLSEHKRGDLDTERMLEMREQGMSYAAIAEEFGCSKYTAQKRIKEANHKVVSVEWLEDREDVYCGTVDDPTHRFIVATGDNDGVLVANCGEQPLPPFGACLLGSFNLARYVRAESTKYSFDYDLLRHDVPHVVRAMDNIVDMATYPLYEQEKEARSKRRMGLGVTGLANAIEACGHRYGSIDFVAMETTILGLIARESYRASVQLAREKGCFPLFSATDFLGEGTFASTLDDETKDLIRRYGIRNSHLTSIAPTGTISLCADNVSSGIEPVFAYGYDRTVQTFEGEQTVRVEDYGVRQFGHRGRQASEVSVNEHVSVLLAAANNVDSAVSKTCNVPPGTPWADFKQIYVSAWEGGAKGCTTFNIGGKRFGVLNAQEDGTNEPAVCKIDPETGQRDCGD